ncbi:7937_t:CDS:1, partial [Acaulospora colombiana]
MDEKKNRLGFQSQHGIQSPTNSSVLPPPQGQAVQPLLSGVDNGVLGRNPSRPLTNSKRAAQNRAAQRAFRQRKDRYIKDLEAKAKDLDAVKKQLETLQKENDALQQTIRRLEAENAKLKGEDISDDEGRQVFGGNNSNGAGSSNSNYSHYGNSTRDDDDSQVLGDEPWLRHKDSGRKSGFGVNDDRNGSFFSAGSSSSTLSLSRPGSEHSQRLVLTPGPNTDSSVDPCFRPDYRNTNSHSSPSPPSSSSSDRNSRTYQHNNSNNGRPGYPNNEEDSDRVYDDLCELMKTRSRPDLPHNISLWQPQHSPTQQNVVSNGSSTVAG